MSSYLHIDEDDTILVLARDGHGGYRIVEEYVGDLPPVEPGPPLRRASRKPTRGGLANQRNQT